jgi:hypothetical protein
LKINYREAVVNPLPFLSTDFAVRTPEPEHYQPENTRTFGGINIA